VRRIEIQPDLTIRFPHRSPEFDEGVEIGIAAALMATGQHSIERWLSPGSLEQLRAIAAKLGYRVAVEDSAGDLQRVVAHRTDLRPRLRLVAS
jgi:hypothetical protein